MKKLLPFLLLTLFNLTILAQSSIKVPMYGLGEKTKKQLKEDQGYIKLILSKYKTKKEASRNVCGIAWSYLFKNDQRLAMERFNQAWLLNENNVQVYFGFGALMALKGKHEQAHKLYKLGRDKDKEFKIELMCLKWISEIMEGLRDYENIVKTYSRIIEIQPSTKAFRKRGYYYTKLYQADSAISDFIIVLDSIPNDGMTHHYLAYQYFTKNELDNAINSCTNAININTLDITSLHSRAAVYIKMKAFDLAIADIDSCIAIDSTQGPFLRIKGQIYIDAGNKEKGCEFFHKAKEGGDEKAVNLIEDYCDD